MIGVPDAECVESIRRALVLGLVLIVGTAIEQAISVGPRFSVVCSMLIVVMMGKWYDNSAC